MRKYAVRATDVLSSLEWRAILAQEPQYLPKCCAALDALRQACEDIFMDNFNTDAVARQYLYRYYEAKRLHPALDARVDYFSLIASECRNLLTPVL
jgi:hypothetical protein